MPGRLVGRYALLDDLLANLRVGQMAARCASATVDPTTSAITTAPTRASRIDPSHRWFCSLAFVRCRPIGKLSRAEKAEWSAYRCTFGAWFEGRVARPGCEGATAGSNVSGSTLGQSR